MDTMPRMGEPWRLRCETVGSTQTRQGDDPPRPPAVRRAPFWWGLMVWTVALAGCVSPAPPEYGSSGFDALNGLGEQLTDTMLEQAEYRGTHPDLRIDDDSPIQMTKFVNLNGSVTGDRFGYMMAEHMARRFTEHGYRITRHLPPDQLLESTFSSYP